MNEPIRQVELSEINQISTLLLPVNEKILLVPNVTVAEIIPWRELIVQENQPEWWLGLLSWRNREVPIVSFSLLNGDGEPVSSPKRRIAIINNITGDQRLPFCGIITDDLPRLMRIMKDDVVEDNESTRGAAELIHVTVNNEKMVIPNFEYMQTCIIDSLLLVR